MKLQLLVLDSGECSDVVLHPIPKMCSIDFHRGKAGNLKCVPFASNTLYFLCSASRMVFSSFCALFVACLVVVGLTPVAMLYQVHMHSKVDRAKPVDVMVAELTLVRQCAGAACRHDSNVPWPDHMK